MVTKQCRLVQETSAGVVELGSTSERAFLVFVVRTGEEQCQQPEAETEVGSVEVKVKLK